MKKKLLAVLLVAVMVLSLVACGKKESDGTTTGEGGKKDDGTGKKYTYFTALSGTVNTFSPTDWQMNSESTVMSPCQDVLYDFVYDPDAENEYAIIPEMAASMAEDVTAEYAGNETYGVPADATYGYAWKMTLRQDLKWDDGTPITSKDFSYSLQQFLNPEMKNYRADSYTDNNGAIANAKAYYEGTFGEAAGRGKVWEDCKKGDDGKYYIDGHQVFFAWNANTAWCGNAPLKNYADHFDPATVEYFNGLEDARGVIELTDEVIEKLYAFTSSDAWGNESEADLINYMYYDDPALEITWDKVGVITPDDYTLIVVLTHQLEPFYFYYNVGASLSLVKEDLYEANKQQVGALVKSTYGTSVESFASYGPYKMDVYQEGKYIHYTRNENWFGYTDGNHEGMYMTTDIDMQVVEDQATRLSLFLQGKLDDVDLVADDVTDYGTSEYTIYTPESYNAEFAFNTDFDTLKSREGDNINKTIMTYIEFRKAFALSLDRQDYCKSCTPGYTPSYGIVNEYYVYDPNTMAKYRSAEVAQQTLCEVYDAKSIDELSGYNVEEARKLLQQAYDKCYADGNIDDDDIVEIEFHIKSAEPTNQRAVDFCTASMSKAAEGTSLEGRIKFVLVENPDYYNSAKQGACDFIKENWGGAGMNPYTMMACYCTDKSNEYGFKYMNYQATIKVNGEEKTQSVNAWYEALVNGEYSGADPETRLTVMAGIEKALLLNYHIVPVAMYTSPSMISQRIIMASDHYINQLVGWASGYRDIKYSMDDAEWAEYCKSQNNQLSYK